MSRQRFIALLIAAVFAIAGAMYLSTQRNLPRSAHGGAFLPALPNAISSVSALTVRKASVTPAVTLQKQGEHWTVKERADYPADFSKLRRLLLALSDAKIVEEKTANPANFAIIGVEDPSQPSAGGAELEITAQDGKHAVIIGKSVGEGNFARRRGENQSYYIAPAIAVDSEPRSWIDSRLIDIPAASIQRIELKPAQGAAYSVHRIKQNEPDFALDAVPAGRKALEPASLGPSPTTYSNLTIEDVAPAAAEDFSKPGVAVVTLADSSTLTISGVVAGDKHWVRLASSKDTALNAKTSGRAFELSSYRYDAIFRPLDQLLVPKAPPAALKKSTKGGNPAGMSPSQPSSSPTP